MFGDVQTKLATLPTHVLMVSERKKERKMLYNETMG